MAYMDALDLLSEKQVITGTSYSTRAKHCGAPSDWGNSGIPRYVQINALGPLTVGTAIQFHLVGFNKEDLTDAMVLHSTDTYQAADITAKFKTFLPISITGKKYSYICVKYVVTGGTEDEEDHEETLCPPDEVNSYPEEIENGFTAFVTAVADTGLQYPYANPDKMFL